MSEQTMTKEKVSYSELSGSRWVVIIYNDRKTLRNFVKKVLLNIFGKSDSEAESIIGTAESEGSAAVKYYTDPSLAEVAISMVEGMKRNENQPEFKIRLFEILD